MYTPQTETAFVKGDQFRPQTISNPANGTHHQPSRWPGLMKLSTLAEYLDMSVSTANNLVKSGQLPPPTVAPTPRLKRWAREDIDQYLRKSSGTAPAGPSIDDIIASASNKSRGGY